MANRNKKIKPKDVALPGEEEDVQPRAIPVYPRPIYRRGRNLGEERAEKERKRQKKQEYPGVEE